MPCYKREPSAYTNDLSPSVSVQRSLKLKALIRLSWYARAVTCLLAWHGSWFCHRLSAEQHFLQDFMNTQRSLRTACASAQSDQSAGHFVGSKGSKASSGGHRRLWSNCAGRTCNLVGNVVSRLRTRDGNIHECYSVSLQRHFYVIYRRSYERTACHFLQGFRRVLKCLKEWSVMHEIPIIFL